MPEVPSHWIIVVWITQIDFYHLDVLCYIVLLFKQPLEVVPKPRRTSFQNAHIKIVPISPYTVFSIFQRSLTFFYCWKNLSLVSHLRIIQLSLALQWFAHASRVPCWKHKCWMYILQGKGKVTSGGRIGQRLCHSPHGSKKCLWEQYSTLWVGPCGNFQRHLNYEDWFNHALFPVWN